MAEDVSLDLDSRYVDVKTLRKIYHEKVVNIKGKDYILDVHQQKVEDEEDSLFSTLEDFFTEDEFRDDKLTILVFDYLDYQDEKHKVKNDDKDETIDDYVEVNLEIELKDLKRDLGKDKEIRLVEKAIRFIWD